MDIKDFQENFPTGEWPNGSDPVPVPCPRCGGESQGQEISLFGRGFALIAICLDCEAAEKSEQQEKARLAHEHALMVRWQEICPPLYRQTDPARIQAAPLSAVMAWQYGARGLMLHGVTGLGKTRSAWLLMRRLLWEGRSIIAYDEITFGEECARLYLDGDGTGWFQRLATVDVLFIDDLGKAKLTERVESTLWGIVENRIAHLRPVICTTNFKGQALAGRMTENRGESFVRRLKEFCSTVAFLQQA